MRLVFEHPSYFKFPLYFAILYKAGNFHFTYQNIIDEIARFRFECPPGILGLSLNTSW